MKAARFFSRCFGILGGVLMAAAILAAFVFQSGLLQTAAVPQEAEEVCQSFMDSLNRGDLAAAQSLLSGGAELDGDHTGEDAAAALVWQGYVDSLSCTEAGACYVTAQGVAREVTITAMDIPQTWEAIAKQAAGASGSETLEAAARAVLAGEVPTRSREITVNLTLQDGLWRVVPEAALNAALSGGLE